MAEEGFVFDQDGARRVVEATRWVERQQPQRPRPAVEAPFFGCNVQFLRVTGAATTQTSVDYYPAVLRLFDPASGWSNGPDTVWLIHPTSAALTTSGNAVYPAKQLRDAVDVSGTSRPLFVSFGRPMVTEVACVDDELEVTTSN